MGHVTKASGSLTKHMAKELFTILTVTSTKDLGSTIKQTGLVNMKIPRVLTTKACGLMISSMDKVSNFGQKAQNMRASMTSQRNTASVYITGWMGLFTKVTGMTIRSTD